MTQHYTRSTTQVMAYCRKCNRRTMHRVDDRRLGPCLECKTAERTKKQIENDERLQALREQPELF